jgi:hypothetical protein
MLLPNDSWKAFKLRLIGKLTHLRMSEPQKKKLPAMRSQYAAHNRAAVSSHGLIFAIVLGATASRDLTLATILTAPA